MKVFAINSSPRQGGTSFIRDELNKYFAILGMPFVSGQCWNSVLGCE